jgi:hypothetical protein
MTVLGQYSIMCHDIQTLEFAIENREIPAPPRTPRRIKQATNFLNMKIRQKEVFVGAHPEVNFPPCSPLGFSLDKLKESKDEKEILEGSLRNLDAKMLMISDNSDFRELFNVIRKPDFTSKAELLMFNALVNQMDIKTAQIEELKDTLRLSSEAILAKK